MYKKILLPIYTVLLVSYLFSGSVFAGNFDDEDDEFSNLSKVDAFHPPLSGSLMYKEWHYFSMISEELGVSLSSVLTLEGDISDPMKSYAVDIQGYATPLKGGLTSDVYPITSAQWSDKMPDVSIHKSHVSLEKDVYHLYTESVDGKTVFDAEFTPEIDAEPAFEIPVESSGGIMIWLLTSAKMRVDGTLTINKGTAAEKVYILNNVRGYHDHNWGYWNWADDIGWDWGQAVAGNRKEHQKRNRSKAEATGQYTLSFLNMTNSYDTESRQRVIKIWKDDEKISTFENGEVQIQNKEMMVLPYLPDNPFPAVNVMSAISGKNKLDITFTTKSFDPIYLPIDGGYRIIWELTGTYEVSGYINGKKVLFVTDGFAEYFGKPLLLN